jgi:hypothetical protein
MESRIDVDVSESTEIYCSRRELNTILLLSSLQPSHFIYWVIPGCVRRLYLPLLKSSHETNSVN